VNSAFGRQRAGSKGLPLLCVKVALKARGFWRYCAGRVLNGHMKRAADVYWGSYGYKERKKNLARRSKCRANRCNLVAQRLPFCM